jgi:predicted metalloprotease with PDZ domain
LFAFRWLKSPTRQYGAWPPKNNSIGDEMIRRIGFVTGAGILILAFACLSGGSVWAQVAPGTIRLEVDATSAPQKILHAKETIPVKPGALSLYYPEWIPGEHAPDGPITDLAGLKFSAGGKTIPWRRDLVEMFTFHLDVPPAVDSLDVQLDFLLSAPASGFSAGASATAQLALVSWNQVLLYPSGAPVREIPFEASLRLPEGWKYGTALPVISESGGEIHFQRVMLNELVDSPVISGRYYRAFDLTPGQKPSHEIDAAADSEAALNMPPELERHFQNLVTEAYALFGTRHYRDYHFLLTLSDETAHFGLEHHESSDDRVAERSLIDEVLRIDTAGLLPHEYTHSWNGKFRRPEDLSTPDYQQPMKDDLLWVYEGLTEYIGNVLTGRSGLYSPDEYREHLAADAAEFEYTPGRTWRPLQDTADAAQLLYFAGGNWENWRRSVDYYGEGELIWLEVDTRIRQLTGNKKSLDDFCKAFHGGPGGKPELKTYTFEDVVAGLNAVVANDWAGLLKARLESTDAHAPLGGIEGGGWKLIFSETPNEIELAANEASRRSDYRPSAGLLVGDEGTIVDVIHGSAAYDAGLAPGMRIAAVNGQQFSPDVFHEAVARAKSSPRAIEVLAANGTYFRTYSLDYHGGLRYPHLARVEAQPDYLSDIIKSQAK